MTNIFKTMLLVLALCGSTIAFASVPFKGSGNAEIVSVQPGPAGVLMTAVASGEATHLGRYTRVENITLVDGTITGTVTFTAANGDELTAAIDGAFTSPATAAGTYAFTGGTGRFANATGTAYFLAALSDPVHFTVNFSGTIDY